MNITDSQYDKWMDMSRVICDNNVYKDILHDVLINFTTKNIDLDGVSDSYVFISIRNHWLNYLQREKKFVRGDNDNDTHVDDGEDIRNDQLRDDKISKMKNILTEVLLRNANDFDYKIINLYVYKGLSVKDISDDIKMSRSMLYRKIRYIKELVREEYNKKNKK